MGSLFPYEIEVAGTTIQFTRLTPAVIRFIVSYLKVHKEVRLNGKKLILNEKGLPEYESS